VLVVDLCESNVLITTYHTLVVLNTIMKHFVS